MRQVVYRIIVALAASMSCLAQSSAPSFEVASIRPVPPGRPRVGCAQGPICIEIAPGSLTTRDSELEDLVQWAYDTPPVQIDGNSSLMGNRFDVIAKAAQPVDETQLRLMLQTLLVERFGLKVHKEQRNMTAYAMTLARGGPKFQESTTDGSFSLERVSPVVLNAHHARMNDLAQGIAGEIGRPVVNATGLNGRYEIHLDLSPYLVKPVTASGDGQFDMMAVFFTGLKDLLGLMLESRKENVDVLVIDHAEKTPTEN